MTIGKRVLMLQITDECPRNGEGDFIRLTDGSILYVYTRYRKSDGNDAAPADLYYVKSADEGENWSSPELFLAKDDSARNFMSVSLIRLADGAVGVFYLRKGSDGSCVMNMCRSYDECKTFTKPIRIIPELSYYVTNNDRVVRLSDGSLVFPANRHELDEKTVPCGECNLCEFFVSRDDGFTWTKLEGTLKPPFENMKFGLQESGIYEQKDGALFAWSRTLYGSQYVSYSHDGGKSFTVPRPSLQFTSSLSPMQYKDACGHTLAAYNPIPNYAGRGRIDCADARTPLACAVSDDGGKTFPRLYYIEDDESKFYCYPAIFDGRDYFLAAYYYNDDVKRPLSNCVIKKINKKEIEEK